MWIYIRTVNLHWESSYWSLPLWSKKINTTKGWFRPLVILPGICTLIFALIETRNNCIDFSGDEIFNLLVVVRRQLGSNMLLFSNHSKWNVQILNNGQSSGNHTAGKPSTLFCGWKCRGKNAWWPNRSLPLLIFVISCQSFSASLD